MERSAEWRRSPGRVAKIPWVPGEGIEPSWGKPRGILSPVRLPVSPPRRFVPSLFKPALSDCQGERIRDSRQRAGGRKRRTPGCHRGDTLSPLAPFRVETHSPSALGLAVETLDSFGDAGPAADGASSGTPDALSS